MQSVEGRRPHSKLRWAIGIALLLAIVGIGAYGFYEKFIAPTQVLAARVGDTTYTQGDLVKRMRLLQASATALEQRFDIGTVPFEVLSSMAEAELIRRAAPRFNVAVSEDDVEAALRQRFYPQIPEGQDVRPGQAERQYKEEYQRFVNRSHLSDKDYRQIVEESIYRARMREKLGEKVPNIGEQVEVHWIRLPSIFGAPGGAPPRISPEQVLERLQEEDFEAVAREVGVPSRYADRKGYVGWVPKGAFPSLDTVLFGSEKRGPIAYGELSEPIATPDETYIVKLTAGPQQREISEVMRERLKDRVLGDWLLAEQAVGTKEGWFEVKFDSEIYRWVIEQVKQTAPRVTPQAGG